MKYNTEHTTDLQRTFAEMLQHYNYDGIKRIAGSLGENPYNIGELIREFDDAADKLLDSEDDTTAQETELALSIAGQIVDEIYCEYFIPQSIKVDPYEKFIEWEDINGTQRFENPRAIGLWDEDIEFHLLNDFLYTKETTDYFVAIVRHNHSGLGDYWEAVKAIRLFAEFKDAAEWLRPYFPYDVDDDDFIEAIKSLYEEYQDAGEVFDQITYP